MANSSCIGYKREDRDYIYVMDILIIDDDAMNNFICKVSIQSVFKEAKVRAFEKPMEALDFITKNYNVQQGSKTLMLLDINMPVLTGWDFLTELKKLDPVTLNNFNIYILSSSIDKRDMDKAKSEPNVVDFISKPLKKEIISQLFSV